MHILGVSAYYHDSAAAILCDGNIVAAAQEERFTRRKHDAGLPENAIRYCLEEAGLKRGDRIARVAFYDKPITKFTRLLTTVAATAPRGFKPFLYAVPLWVREKAWPGAAVERVLRSAGIRAEGYRFPEHHQSHAASAFFPSPFHEAAILTADGVGEWTCSSIAVGTGNRIELLREQRFPHSLGLLYSAFTHFTGFRVNSGEYKLMGLAPYGRPVFADRIREHLVEIRDDGSIYLHMENFGFHSGLEMTNDRFAGLFGGPRRMPESPITQREMDIAASIQQVTEDVVFKMARYAAAVTGRDRLCMAGGVALNCVANGKLHASGLFKEIWVQPAAGDAGGALGAALHVWHQLEDGPKSTVDGDTMQSAALGPRYDARRIRQFLDTNHIPYRELSPAERASVIARQLADGKVVGMFEGRMEFGPRALGRRSILADPRSATMQSFLNLSTKFRESFRPFAPVVLAEDVGEWFDFAGESPYMLMVAPVRDARRRAVDAPADPPDLISWVNQCRSEVPAVTHVDFSARLQTVALHHNPKLHSILAEFKNATGCPMLVNTSFNVRSEPIVCTPEDAYVCFMRTGIHTLVIEDFLLEKDKQPAWQEATDWREGFGLD
jgi:carbamoyltransferase